MGRKDSVTASLELANSNIPTADESLFSIISKFLYQGLTVTDMVALAGMNLINIIEYLVALIHQPCIISRNTTVVTDMNTYQKEKFCSGCLDFMFICFASQIVNHNIRKPMILTI